MSTLELVKVHADKLRAGDTIYIADYEGTTPNTVAGCEYFGWVTGLNCVKLGIVGEDGEAHYIQKHGGQAGVYYPGEGFYVEASQAEAIQARPTAMDEHYSEAS